MKRRDLLSLSGLLGLELVLSGCTTKYKFIRVPCNSCKDDKEVIEEMDNESLDEIIVHECPPPAVKGKNYRDEISDEFKALLDTIAWAEGTCNYYNMMFGRMLFTDFSAHPVETGEMPPKGFPFGPRWRRNTSTAAGRYQFLYRTYLALKEEGQFVEGFYPKDQDLAALYTIQEMKGVDQEMLDGAIADRDFSVVWERLSPEWASLPYPKTKKSRYRGQHAYSEKDLLKVFFYHYSVYGKT